MLVFPVLRQLDLVFCSNYLLFQLNVFSRLSDRFDFSGQLIT